jgi:hypothetical protein
MAPLIIWLLWLVWPASVATIIASRPPPTAGVRAAAAAPSGQSNEALRAALTDAGSSEPARHQAVLQRLQTRAFLETVDSPADYGAAAKLRLRVDQVVEALARNPAPSAQRAFLALTTNRIFLAHDERVISLILASVNLRPAPPALVRFWDRRSRPDDGFTPTTIRALVDNGSKPAIALLERKMVDPGHSRDAKISWMRSDILRHRNDLPLLQGCTRLLRGKLSKSLRPLLVEVLFDYRPGEWFRPASSYSPPPLMSASEGSRGELRKIAELALATVSLSPEQRSAVTARMSELEKLADSGGGVH